MIGESEGRWGHVWGGGGERGKDMYGFDNQVSQPRASAGNYNWFKVQNRTTAHSRLHAYSCMHTLNVGVMHGFVFLFWLCASKYIVISLFRSCKQKCQYFSYVISISRDSLSVFSGINTRQYGVFVSCFWIVDGRIRFIWQRVRQREILDKGIRVLYGFSRSFNGVANIRTQRERLVEENIKCHSAA